MLSPYDSGRTDFTQQYESPSWAHPFGTDDLGRDLFTRVMLGGRLTLSVAFVSVALALLIGVAAGGVAGFAGGWLDGLVMRTTDLVLAVPIFFIILLASSLTTPGFLLLCALVAATQWMEIARVVRAVVLSTRERDFVEAARALGASEARILVRHVLRHATGPLAIAATIAFAQAIALESALSFLGYGVQPPSPSWGAMLQSAKGVLGVAPWLAFFPGATIFVTVLSAYVLGDFLRSRTLPSDRA
jgi:peptide/nickel transport system permease protein